MATSFRAVSDLVMLAIPKPMLEGFYPFADQKLDLKIQRKQIVIVSHKKSKYQLRELLVPSDIETALGLHSSHAQQGTFNLQSLFQIG